MKIRQKAMLVEGKTSARAFHHHLVGGKNKLGMPEEERKRNGPCI